MQSHPRLVAVMANELLKRLRLDAGTVENHPVSDADCVALLEQTFGTFDVLG
jgi:hypothetical protein